MANILQTHFPMIRERQELIDYIASRQDLKLIYDGWREERQKEFLDFCSGVSGMKLTYDGFFKEIMNPEIHPERLADFLSCILGEGPVKILRVIPNDSSRIADESSLVIMDIVVELEDGQIVNAEIQKHGYKFPGQRSACYSADLLLRQYKRIRDEKGSSFFNYKDIKTVYTIVLFEKSTELFHEYPSHYIHKSMQQTDTGLEIDLLQKYIFIPLDIFKGKLYVKGIENKLDAWLSFLACDDPVIIAKLIAEYPEFKKLYEDAYYICQNVERVMNMFSEELRILDRNTVQLMIDEQQAEIDRKDELINSFVKVFVKDCMERGDSQEVMVSRLCDMYDMTTDEAEKYVKGIK
ncbi:MAG: Rpn family recombination-promoting nuclease/putative transposase [Clostridium sp.]|nr:Rpn family recombination-promoting nuclease/putative transposase [Clostridium sp.]MCM1172138.1 Rpn family recombination-promoting nuclease/putative transposase [Clostridium sp.]MCM1207724.1 Rpn family recombination-promoting nuclease/putative transposase [Ruminococcus sp.]